MNIEQAITSYRNAAIAKESEGGPNDHALHDRMVSPYRELCAIGSDGMDSFRALLQDANPEVRIWVAAQFLATGETAALPILHEIANGSGLVAFNARMALAEYSSASLDKPLGEPAAQQVD